MTGNNRPPPLALWLVPALLLAGLFLPQCHLDQSRDREERYVTVRLHDSLSHYDSVEIVILAGGDTGKVVGTIWRGHLDAPDSIPPHRLDEGESRALTIRVKGYDAAGRLVLDLRISNENGSQIVIDAPLPKPSPALASLSIAPGSLSPPFSPSIREYSVSLAYGQDSLEVTATPAYDSASMRVGFLAATAGRAFGPIALRTGENRITLNVTAIDSSAQYVLTVHRALPVDSPAHPDTLPDPKGAYAAWKHVAMVNVNFKPLVLSLSSVQIGTRVADFPLLVRLTKSNFTLAVAADSGRDIRFATSANRALPFEIIRWDPAQGEADIFVKVDTLLYGRENDPILMYWGNPGAVQASDPAGVFPAASGWSGVWHLEESGKGDPGEYRDATGRFHGAAAGPSLAPVRGGGMAGYGQVFPAAEGSAIALPGEFDPGQEAWTLHMWIKRQKSGTGVLFNKGEEEDFEGEEEGFGAGGYAGKQRIEIDLLAGTGQKANLWLNGGLYLTRTSLLPDQFCLIGMVYDGKSVKLYEDGYLRQSAAWTQGSDPSGKVFLGALDRQATGGISGSLDEFWASSTARSPAYMRLVYENQKPYSTVVTVVPLY